MTKDILERYLKVQRLENGATTPGEAANARKLRERMEREHPGIAEEAALHDLAERLGVDSAVRGATAGKGKGKRGDDTPTLPPWVANLQALFGAGTGTIDQITKLVDELEGLGILGGAAEPEEIEIDDDLVGLLAERVKLHNVEVGKRRAARGGKRRNAIRIDFEIPVSVFEEHVGPLDDDDEAGILPDGALALVAVLHDAILDALDEARDPGDDD
jgi:chorismate mutase